ncbi:MAG: hypothetical protein WDN00_10525 [Limisphaerales bacterium]
MPNIPIERISYALNHMMGKSVQVFPREQWKKLVHANGEPTLLMSAADLGMNMKNACVVAVAASGVANSNPGADIIRYDAGDYPFIYNTDHYSVLERLHNHPNFEGILQLAGIQPNEALQQMLDQNVFIVGPEKLENHHWQKEILPHIRNAGWKE